jgi:hypothetical protein
VAALSESTSRSLNAAIGDDVASLEPSDFLSKLRSYKGA